MKPMTESSIHPTPDPSGASHSKESTMPQQQLEQQQQTGARITDMEGESLRFLSRLPDAAEAGYEDLLTDDQKVRIECLNAARDLVMTVGAGGQETSVSMVDLITVALYIVDGQDPFSLAHLTSVRPAK